MQTSSTFFQKYILYQHPAGDGKTSPGYFLSHVSAKNGQTHIEIEEGDFLVWNLELTSSSVTVDIPVSALLLIQGLPRSW